MPDGCLRPSHLQLSGPYRLVAIVKGEEAVIDELDDRELSLVLGGTMQRLLPPA